MQVLQLDPVLDRAQPAVGLRQPGAVLHPDVAADGQRLERLEGVGAAQQRIGAAVDELQQLHRELDVAQSPGPELELAVDLVARDVLLDPPAHRLHVLDEVRPVTRRPHQRGERVDVALDRGASSPATGRALSSAWNSHVRAHRR